MSQRPSPGSAPLPGAADAKAPPVYEQIKNYIRQCIASGTWKPGDMISSENELVQQFGVSRMTVVRALRDLTDAHLLTRVQGAGTFVATPRYESTVAEIRSIAEEVRSRGRTYSARVLTLESTTDAAALGALAAGGAAVFHSRVIHYEDGIPIQYEDRLVNPALFPGYLEQDFTAQTPSGYLSRVAPLERVEYEISAQVPNTAMRRRLALDDGEPCLVLARRTWVARVPATAVQLWHPASRFRFSGVSTE